MLERPKVLVVDDLSANLLSMKTLLKNVDSEIITTKSGNEALSIAVKENLALILLDVNMPEMDGFEVAGFLNEAEETKNIPIIFVTAVSHDKASIIKGYNCGAVDYVEKPITPEILISKVNSFIGLWKLKAGLELENNLRKTAEKKIEYLAHHDPLTKLPNRRQLHTELKILLDRSKRSKERVAVLFLDLDGFKKINDELGHETGDDTLIKVAARFREQVRSFDIIARYGGDEFIIVLSDISESLLLTPKLNKLIEVVSEPINSQGIEINIGVSIGVAIYPEHGTTADNLISYADKAMYQAKKEGKNCFKFFSDDLNQQLTRRLLVEKHLRVAIKNQELEVYYQPLIDNATGLPKGAEALLRWHCEVLGEVLPDEFIPVAESSGLISEIGVWVLQQIVPVMKHWKSLNFAINASSLQFQNNRLYDELTTLIQLGDLDPSRLEVEITESLLLADSISVKQQIQDISDLGVGLSIDDFGTGYSSLSYLKNCPVNTVKIDRSFIAEIPECVENCALVTAIIAMAKALSLKVIAEGIEDEAQWKFLQQLNCDFSQGYYFSKPVPLLEFETYVKANIS